MLRLSGTSDYRRFNELLMYATAYGLSSSTVTVTAIAVPVPLTSRSGSDTMRCADCGLPVYVFVNGRRSTIQKFMESYLDPGRLKYAPAHRRWCTSEDARNKRFRNSSTTRRKSCTVPV